MRKAIRSVKIHCGMSHHRDQYASSQYPKQSAERHQYLFNQQPVSLNNASMRASSANSTTSPYFNFGSNSHRYEAQPTSRPSDRHSMRYSNNSPQWNMRNEPPQYHYVSDEPPVQSIGLYSSPEVHYTPPFPILSTRSSPSNKSSVPNNSFMKNTTPDLIQQLVEHESYSHPTLFFSEVTDPTTMKRLKDRLNTYGMVNKAEICTYQSRDVLLVQLIDIDDDLISERNLKPYSKAAFFIQDPRTIFLKCRNTLLESLKENKFKDLSSIFDKYGHFKADIVNVRVQKKTGIASHRYASRKDLKLSSDKDFVMGVVSNNDTFISNGRLYLKMNLELKIAEKTDLNDLGFSSNLDSDINEMIPLNKDGLATITQKVKYKNESESNAQSDVESIQFEKHERKIYYTDDDEELDFSAANQNRDYDQDSDVEVLGHDFTGYPNVQLDDLEFEKETGWTQLTPGKFKKTPHLSEEPKLSDDDIIESDYSEAEIIEPFKKKSVSAKELLSKIREQTREINTSKKRTASSYDLDNDLEISSPPSRTTESHSKKGKPVSIPFPKTVYSSSMAQRQLISKSQSNLGILNGKEINTVKHKSKNFIEEVDLDSKYLLIKNVGPDEIDLRLPLLENGFLEDVKERIEKYGAKIDTIYYDLENQLVMLLMENKKSVITTLKYLHDFRYNSSGLEIRLGLCDKKIANMIEQNAKSVSLNDDGFEEAYEIVPDTD